MTEVNIRIPGLDKADALELGEYVPPDALEVEEQQAPEGAFGELALATAIVFGSVVALKGFVAWLAYRNKGKKIEQEIEVCDAQGNRKTYRLKVDDRTGDATDVELAKQLANVTGFDAQALLDQPL